MNVCPKCQQNTAKASMTYPDILVCYCGGPTLQEVGTINDLGVENFLNKMSSLYFSQLQDELTSEQFSYCVSQNKKNMNPSDKDFLICWEGDFLCQNELITEVLDKHGNVPDVWNLPEFLQRTYQGEESSHMLINDIFSKIKEKFRNY